jgi:hypothetical protein
MSDQKIGRAHRGWPNLSSQMKMQALGPNLVARLQEKVRLDSSYNKALSQEMEMQRELQGIYSKEDLLSLEIVRLQQEVQDLQEQSKKRNRELQIIRVGLRESRERMTLIDNEVLGLEQSIARPLHFAHGQAELKPPAASPERDIEGSQEKDIYLSRSDNEGLVAYIMRQGPAKKGEAEIEWVEGTTLLMYAAATGDVSFVKLIFRYDSDLEAKDSVGRDPVDWAELAGNTETKEFLEECRERRFLILIGFLILVNLETSVGEDQEGDGGLRMGAS